VRQGTPYEIVAVIRAPRRTPRLRIATIGAMKRSVDFNCDLGEGGDDAALMPHLSSASIACGWHAGDADTMLRSVRLCVEHGIAIGAHPSFADREHFGRRELQVTAAEAHNLVLYQVGALAAFVRAAGARLQHVKPHGALYNLAARDRTLADAIASAVHAYDPGLILFALSNSALAAAGSALGLAVAHEAFAERRYERDGSLAPRSAPDAVIRDVDLSAQQVAQMLRSGRVTARDGSEVAVRADTICLHGDREDAATFAAALRRAIEDAGFEVRPPAAARTPRRTDARRP
jgi:UPF0271 protein